jgi:hypothetical protein
MKKTALLGSLLIAGMGLGLMGCMPKPKALSQALYIPTAGTLPAGGYPDKTTRLGRFNVQKRHGLGAWEGGPPPMSERDLLRHLSRSAPVHFASSLDRLSKS